MMRRGGRGNNVQAPWIGHDDAIPSARHFERGWAARNYVQVAILAACSIAISIMIWSSRPGRPPGPHLLGHNLQSRNPGFVFPLYHYYQQFPNSSDVVGGRARWRDSRVGNGRGIRSEESMPLFNVRGGHRLNDQDIQQFYIEMKLGVPPKPFHFHVDTGSGPLWVYCTVRSYASTIATLGPHGMFVPEDDSYVKCTGATATLCRALQVGVEECDMEHDYQCLFSIYYADGSTFSGFVVNGSITVPMQDNTEIKVFGLFGCVLQKELKNPEQLPLITDGLIGLGNCKGTLVDQLSTSKVISQNVLGVCLAKGMHWSTLPAGPAAPVGYISLGMDFEEKFDQSNSVWVKLTDPGPGISCAYAAKLLSISFHDRRISVRSMFPHVETVGMAMILDTGSDLTYLHTDMYGPLLKTLDTYATNKDYFRVQDNDQYIASEQRVCWEPPAKKLAKASPIHDFRPLKLAFEGIASATERAPLQYLIIQPVNYLTWDAHERKLCVNILEDSTAGFAVSNLGAEVMREHLFVFDFENQRVRWKSSSDCEL